MGKSAVEQVLHFPWTCYNLFVHPKFAVHRVFGFAYLIQWCAALYLYFADYEYFARSSLVWSLPLNGVVQSLTATYYFSFLPRKVDPGYYSDKSSLSYDFVKENIFFAVILMFQWLYYSDAFYGPIKKSITGEYLFVFFPYFFRSLVPKSSFRDALKDPRNKSDKNRTFYIVVTWVTKVFYVWAKHYIGFFMNYMRFLDRISAEQQYHMYFLLIFSACATTILMFLHTLKFKGYIGPRTSYLLYMASYLATFYSFLRIGDVFLRSPDLVLVALGGVLLNFSPVWCQWTYQVLVAALLFGMRSGNDPRSVLGVLSTVCSYVATVWLQVSLRSGCGSAVDTSRIVPTPPFLY
jgi:hypothetical protein